MISSSKSRLFDTEVCGKSLREWESLWTPLTGGFAQKQTDLRRQVGLARAKLDGEVMYILRGTEYGKGGIEKGLQRLRGAPQTGNESFGPQMIRKYLDRLQLEVLCIGEDSEAAKITQALKPRMIELHDPEWNRPHQKRMKELHEGKRK